MPTKDRQFYRKVIDIPSNLIWDGGYIPVIIKDLSLNGMYIQIPSVVSRHIDVYDNVTLEYILPNKKETEFSEEYVVVRIDNDHMALTLMNIPQSQPNKGFYIDSMKIGNTDLFKNLEME